LPFFYFIAGSENLDTLRIKIFLFICETFYHHHQLFRHRNQNGVPLSSSSSNQRPSKRKIKKVSPNKTSLVNQPLTPQKSKRTHRSNANLKTGPLQVLIKKRQKMKSIQYSEEYNK